MESLNNPVTGASLNLERVPVRQRETLRAWDAADEYLLHHFSEHALSKDDHTLVINDSFGALSLGLAEFSPVVWSNSWLTHGGLKHNARLNNIDISGLSLLPSTEQPQQAPSVICMKLPHNTCLLTEQLDTLRQLVPKGTTLVAADMAKHIHSSTLELFEKHFGTTTTSLAKKKARLIFSTVDKSLSPAPSPYPRTIEHNGMKLVNHAGVFSRQKLDIGTGFFLEHLPVAQQDADIVDLGCGNGALGIHIAQQNTEARLHFVDESFMSVASAKDSWEANGLEDRAQFTANDCLTGFEPRSVNIVVCNPPFHQGNTVGDHIAWRMFQQSCNALKKGGELRVIGNRHLGYHTKLKKLFGNCHSIASNGKFVVLSARRSD